MEDIIRNQEMALGICLQKTLSAKNRQICCLRSAGKSSATKFMIVLCSLITETEMYN